MKNIPHTPVQSILVVARTFSIKPGEDQGLQKVKDVKPLIDACSTLASTLGLRINLRLVVPINTDYKDHDKANTAKYLKAVYGKMENVEICTTKKDLTCGCMNEALFEAYAYSDILFVSPSAASYLSPENVRAMIDARNKGARAAGLSLEEVPGEIMDNSFAMWHVLSLVTAGGFDPSSAAPRIDAVNHPTVTGPGGEVYPLFGVEEVRVLIRMTREWGKCFAYLDPITGGKRSLPEEPDKRARKIALNATKELRRIKMAELEGESLLYLETGRME